MKKILLATSALAVSGFVASDAAAVSVELYGQVNKSLLAVDDSENTDMNIVDNDVSSTRMGLKGSQVLDNGLTASVLLEAEIQTNASNTETQNESTTFSDAQTQNGSATNFVARHARVGLAGDFGAVFIGTQSTATDSVTEQDLAGVADLMYSGAAEDLVGGYQYRLQDGTFPSPDVNVDINNMDGRGRADSVRYDSPIFNGFQGRVSMTQGGDMDLGAYYSGKYDAFMVKAALGHVIYNDQATSNPSNAASLDDLESQTSGSVSVKHDSGIAGTLAYGKRAYEALSTGNDEPTFMYAKVGYEWDAFEVAADYTSMDDVNLTDSEETSFGLGAQYNMGNGVSLAATYRSLSKEATVSNVEVDYEDISVYGVNMRVKF